MRDDAGPFGYTERMKGLPLALALGCIAVSACGGGGSTMTGGCTSLAPPVMLYPAPSATGVPDGNLDIWVGYATNPSIAWSVPSLSTGPGVPPVIAGTPWTPPSPGPTNPPGLLPLPDGDSYWTSGIGALPAATAFTVNVTNLACAQSFSLGSFTTK